MDKQRDCCNSAVNDLLVTKKSKCNDLQGIDGGYQFEFTWHHQYIQETAETVVEIKLP